MAVTVTLNDAPAVADAGADTVRWVAAAAPTAIVPLVPVIDAVTVSVAVMVRLPAVFSVAEPLWTPASPPVNVWSAGNTAAASDDVK